MERFSFHTCTHLIAPTLAPTQVMFASTPVLTLILPRTRFSILKLASPAAHEAVEQRVGAFWGSSVALRLDFHFPSLFLPSLRFFHAASAPLNYKAIYT